ncbi:metallophosphoesterase [Croceivirga lutea]|uniref:metallophosphoesterase n=1 Tax=Croceivirga lutea TaxID=1775167 RepID=UPI00163AFB65|nr:metallophosphoesterase [Croceivirga lutea]GGG56079.1 metallophosphoesterase [Croceivirga lutea]
MNRRKFLKGTTALAGAGVVTGVYGWQVEPFWLEFVQLKMPIINLPEHLEGKTLMQISDVHVGPVVKDSFIIDALSEAKEYNPDFVVYTGDYVHYRGENVLTQLKEITKHFVTGKLGTVGILGNHDFGDLWAQPEVANQISAILEQQNITVLRNSNVTIEGLNFIGIDDFWGTNFYPEKVLNNINHNKANLVLCHNPDVCDLPIWNNYKGWILSGHTHGGQVKPPFLPPPILPVDNKNYDQGLKKLSDGRTLYINRALGHLKQIRFNVRPEITIFELTKS